MPTSGNIVAADKSNFNGWDIRKKRNPTSGAVLTFAGLPGQSKSCRSRVNHAVFNNTAAPAGAGVDVFDTIGEFNNGLLGVPHQVPSWTVINGTDYGRDFACGGIYSTGPLATGNTGADNSLAHDADGNWQDLTPGVVPGGTDSADTANGCNATDKYCVFKELISGLMVTEISAATYTWEGAINYCHKLGEATHPVTELQSPIPVIGVSGVVTYSDWRLPTQKELLNLGVSGIRGLNQTNSLITNFGNTESDLWSSCTGASSTTFGLYVSLKTNGTAGYIKTDSYRAICVR